MKVENHPLGYPRFAALISSHPTLFAFRRFATLRARLLLQKQCTISDLEMQLRQIDCNETKPMCLGSYGTDTNSARKTVLEQLDTAMAEYGERSQWLDTATGLD